MRHPTEPANHKCLTATVLAVFVAFAALIAAREWSAHDDQALRLAMLPIYAKVNR